MGFSTGVFIVGIANLAGVILERGLIARFFHFASLCFAFLTCLGLIYFNSGEIAGFARKVFIEEAIEKGVQVVFAFISILTVSAIVFRKIALNYQIAISRQIRIIDKRQGHRFYFISLSMMCLYVFTIYPSQIFSRSSHLVETPIPQIRSMHGIFIILGIFSALVPLTVKCKVPKYIGYLILFLWLLLTVAKESRSSLIVMAAFMYLIWINSTSRKSRYLGVIVMFLFSLVVYFFITINRNANIHGLLYIFQTPLDQRVFAIWFENLAFILPVIGYTTIVAQPSTEFILTSLNPMPGGIAGWSTFSGKSAISSFVPFSGLGLSYAYGVPFFFFLWSVVFIVIAISIRITKLPIFRIPVLLSFGLALTLVSQYELRSAIRYIYFGLAISILQLTLKKYSSSATHNSSTGDTQ